MNLNNTQLKKVNNGEKEIEKETEKMISKILNLFNVKSKKKRIRHKVYKKAIAQSNGSDASFNEAEQLAFISKTFAEFKEERKNHNEVILEVNPVALDVQPQVPTNSLAGVPVTHLLKLGKQFFTNEQIVRNYYKADTLYYKNRSLLEHTLEEGVLELSMVQQTEFWGMVESHISKKAKD